MELAEALPTYKTMTDGKKQEPVRAGTPSFSGLRCTPLLPVRALAVLAEPLES